MKRCTTLAISIQLISTHLTHPTPRLRHQQESPEVGGHHPVCSFARAADFPQAPGEERDAAFRDALVERVQALGLDLEDLVIDFPVSNESIAQAFQQLKTVGIGLPRSIKLPSFDRDFIPLMHILPSSLEGSLFGRSGTPPSPNLASHLIEVASSPSQRRLRVSDEIAVMKTGHVTKSVQVGDLVHK
ncbi:hypothetical protein IAR55_006893 [Kwoniella newhampshirensis]|uniref:Amidase domain-containing protein n=1 Tax=Kwoniella newhampshirensis TaxID=1651941 RepID=A0AAW0YTQ8_9TREE